jgi:hypothetical protein
MKLARNDSRIGLRVPSKRVHSVLLSYGEERIVAVSTSGWQLVTIRIARIGKSR